MSRYPLKYLTKNPPYVPPSKKNDNSKYQFIIDNREKIIELLNDDKYLEISTLLKKQSSDGLAKDLALTTLFSRCSTDEELLKIILFKYINNNHTPPSSITTNIIINGHIELFLTLLEYYPNYELGNCIDDITESKYAPQFLDIFLDKGQRLMECDLYIAISWNKIDIVRHAFNNNYDIQSIVDTVRWDKFGRYDINMFKLMIHNNIDLTKYLDTIICQVIEYNKLDVIILFVNTYSNCDLNKYLKHSCLNNKLDIMKYLLHMGANINIIDNSWIPRNLNIEIFKFLVHCNVDIHVSTLNMLLLYNFIHNSDINDLIFIISQGASIQHIFDLEEQNKYNISTIIRNKIKNGNYERVNSPLEYITSMGKLEYIKYLYENYNHLLQPEIDRLFIIACANGQCEIAKYLYSLNANLDSKALISACFFGHLEIIKLLISYGMDCENIEVNLLGVLEDAIYNNNKQSKTYDNLIFNNTIFRNDIFHHKYQGDHLLDKLSDIIKILIKCYVPLPEKTKFWSPFSGMIYHDVEFIKYYIKCGHDINKIFYNDRNEPSTLIEGAVLFRDHKMIKFLLECGAVLPNNDFLDKHTKYNQGFRKFLLECGAELLVID
jgi:hypothetical protein